MSATRLLTAMVTVWLVWSATAQAQSWGEIGNSLLKGLGGPSEQPQSGGGLATEEVVEGLREALATGSEIVVAELGRPDGFLKHPDVSIPLPGPLESIGKGMRSFGMGRYVDAFETSLNRAAEQAVPEPQPEPESEPDPGPESGKKVDPGEQGSLF